MKKMYIKPNCKERFYDYEDVIMVSGVIGDGVNVDYGGVDEDGDLDPAANACSVWDDDDFCSGYDELNTQ